MRLCLYQGLCKNTATPQLYRQSALSSVWSMADCGICRRREVDSVDSPLATPNYLQLRWLHCLSSQNRVLVTTSRTHVRARHSAAWYVVDNRHCRA